MARRRTGDNTLTVTLHEGASALLIRARYDARYAAYAIDTPLAATLRYDTPLLCRALPMLVTPCYCWRALLRYAMLLMRCCYVTDRLRRCCKITARDEAADKTVRSAGVSNYAE